VEAISHAAASALGAVVSLRCSAGSGSASFEAWRALLLVLFDGTLSRSFPSSSFESDLIVQHFGTFLLCKSFASGGRYRREPSRLVWDDLDHVVVSCLLSGSIALGGAVGRLRPGDVTIVDLSSPANFVLAAAEALHLIVPRMALPSAVVSAAPAPCRIFARETAMGMFIRGVIETLFQASRYFNAVEMLALGAYVPELLGWCLGTSPVASSARGKGDLGRRLRRYIEENLNRTDLTSSRLMHEIGVSRSQLYRQFEANGGVDAYIRRRRLRRSLQALIDPRRADRRIGEIAYDMGFADEAHFSRLFRQTYGQSPRDIRSTVRQGGSRSVDEPPIPSGDEASFAGWLLALGTG
jgi:AraC-like DNA-binding protein